MPLIEVLEDDPPSQNYMTEKTVEHLVETTSEKESIKSTSIQIQDVTEETSGKVRDDSEILDNKNITVSGNNLTFVWCY